MGRNYFSKHGGPYFINDGFHNQGLKTSIEKDKQNQKFFYGLTLLSLFVILGVIGLLYSLA
jgi:hypothetical protein